MPLIRAALIGSLIAVAGADARDEALIKCVEGGGIYHDDGRCEGGTHGDPAPADAAPDAAAPVDAEPRADDGREIRVETADSSEAEAKKACRKQGGRYRDGECQLPKDPVERCKALGGMFMVDGRCYRPER
jgi:hypothetical protein